MLVDEQQKRVGLLMAASLFHGASIGPLIDLAIEVDLWYWLIPCQARHDDLEFDVL